MSSKRRFLLEVKYNAYPWKKLFGPLGIKNVAWEQDRSGTFVCSSYLHMTARDLAKIAYLYLNNGVWDGNRMLPENWVQTATSDTLSKRHISETSAYGSSWYMNFDYASEFRSREMPSIPANSFWARGHWGQWLVVFPDYDTIIVRFGDDRGAAFPIEEFLKSILDSMDKI